MGQLGWGQCRDRHEEGKNPGRLVPLLLPSHNPSLRDDIRLDLFELMWKFGVTGNNKEIFMASHLGMEGIER